MLRHYDDIGLLPPSDRSVAGYRQYSEEDLKRLQRILSLRATGMGLAEIAAALNGEMSERESLEQQSALLRGRIELMAVQLEAVERTRRAVIMGINLGPEEMFEVFGDNDPAEHAEEAEQRWGETDAYRESQRRTQKYSKEDWLRIQAEGEEVVKGFLNAMQAGLPADSPEAMAAAEAHRKNINDWFYPCSYDMQVNLAEMYVADARFTAHYDQYAPGLAQYVADAIFANALANS
jgi:DNA-binding transcriptional MerR regulator